MKLGLGVLIPSFPPCFKLDYLEIQDKIEFFFTSYGNSKLSQAHFSLVMVNLNKV